MEIKNKLTMIRQKERGITGERRERGKSRHMDKGLKGTDNGVGIDCGSRVGTGQGRETGKKVGQL